MSLQQAIARGVHLVGIPVSAIQRLNMARAVFAGYGIITDFNNITRELLNWAIQDAVESSK
jgi:UDP:flavonoid glycosyltransferase YjiC (YdhE family)